MLTLTPNAAEQIREAASQNDAQDMALRVAARVTPAGMLEFGMGFDNERENDKLVESSGVQLLVNAHSAELLDDVTIDFAEVSPGEHGFVFMKAGGMPPGMGGGCGSGGGGGGCGSGGCGSGGCGS